MLFLCNLNGKDISKMGKTVELNDNEVVVDIVKLKCSLLEELLDETLDSKTDREFFFQRAVSIREVLDTIRYEFNECED